VITAEPKISIGILEHAKEVQGKFNGLYSLPNGKFIDGAFLLQVENELLVCKNAEGIEIARETELFIKSTEATFTIHNVTIGINFHWERKENQSFKGAMRCLVSNGEIIIINEISIEQYLLSVISSEMSAEAPSEFLKAHAITSRSWIMAMLERRKKSIALGKQPINYTNTPDEIIRWYDREDHQLFDVCADDHCQRYQGITKVISKNAEEAIKATFGTFLVHNNQICDARFSKACGGRTELFENCWEDTNVPYLQTVVDASEPYPALTTESEANDWIKSSPDVYCNTNDVRFLKMVLPSFDQETTDFFRWKVEYTQEQIRDILADRSGIDFGIVMDIVPLQRGPSGRIYKLKIIGTKHTISVGKELEIRRWLARTHLYSSAFVVDTERKSGGVPRKFIFQGAGWGHGVGLCQIGAAVMAEKGFSAKEILEHFFSEVALKKLY